PYVPPTSRAIVDSVSQAKRIRGETDRPLPEIVQELLSQRPEVARQTAGDWLDAETMRMLNGMNNHGQQLDRVYPTAMRQVIAKFPEVRQQYLSGVVTDASMKIIFRQWFGQGGW